MSSTSVTGTATDTASATASTSAGGLNLSASNANFSIIGICLAVGSGLFIGSSFVIKKKGLLKASRKYGNAAGEGHGYLKSWLWWTGMIMMIVGEILNFVAYAFTVAILVTPMGSVSVVVAAILSHFFLKESLTFFGWIGCILCILGSVILALNAPKEQSVRTIHEFLRYFVSPGFLVWMSLMFVISLVIVFYVAPRWGRKNMMPYISVCSLVGGISVSCTQGLGAAIVTSFQGESQIKHWFFWFLLVFCVVTLLIEINYLNKALELFNTSMVVPVYFCYFTSATMITSFILYRGLKAPAVALVTMVLGFLVICLGITLLQMSKVDPKQLQGLDRRSTLLLDASRQKTESEEKGDVTAAEEPGMDALRGGFGAVGSIIRARSVQRRMSTATGSSSGVSTRHSIRGDYGQPNLNTHGLAHLPRYQLTDNPMHEEMEHMATSPDQHGQMVMSPDQRVPPSPGPPPRIPTPKRSESSIHFDDSDIVHKYGYGQHDGFTTTHLVAHNELHDDSSNPNRERLPSAVQSQRSYATPYADDDARQRESKTQFGRLLETFTHSVNPDPSPRSPTTSHGFPMNFPIPLPGRHNDQVRGGAHRGTHDYPHLSKKDADLDREERTKLVASPVSEGEEGGEDAPELGDLSSGPLGTSRSRGPLSPSNISGLPSPGFGRDRDSPRRPLGPR